MKLKVLVVAIVTMFVVLGWGWKANDKADGVAKLNQLEADFAKATAEKGLDGFMTFYAEDSSELIDGGGIVTGKENIRQALGPWGPDVSLTWAPVKADMAASGDLGYTFGSYVYKATGKDGKPITAYGKYATVWKKQKDGSWKVAFDMGNGSPKPQ